jgi:putative SOS response-associated peptidase YedK
MPMIYRLDAPAREVAHTFGFDAGNDPWPGGSVSAGGFAPVITMGREFVAGPRPEKRLPKRMIPRLWGVPPPPQGWDERRHGILTVRNLESPFWIGNLRNSEFRCLVPASMFMEWGKVDPRDGKRRQCWFGATDQPIFAMAAVWKDSEVPSFALLTTPANAALKAEGRDTMPVILPADPAAHDLWLRGDWKRAAQLVAPYSSSLMSLRVAG